MKKFITFLHILNSFYLFAQGNPENLEFLVNTTTYDNQSSPDISALSDSGFVVCWNSWGQDGDGFGVYGQVFNKNGSKQGSEFSTNTYTNGDQTNPKITHLLDGGFVVCWQSWGQDGDADGIFARIFNKDGTNRGAEFRVNTYTTNYQQAPKIATLTDGGFVICWTSYEQDGNWGDVYTQIYNSDGSQRGQEFRVNEETWGLQWNPDVVNLFDDRFAIFWDSGQFSGSGRGLYIQILNSDGSKQGIEIFVSKYTSTNNYAKASVLTDGGFVVCWEYSDGSFSGILGQKFNWDGSKQGSEFRVNTYTNLSQNRPSVSSLSNGGFIICWQSDGQDGDADGIFAQFFNKDGSKHGIEFQINTFTEGDQNNQSIANLINDGLAICWQSGQDGSITGIYCNYYFSLVDPMHAFFVLQSTYKTANKSTSINWQTASLSKNIFPWELEYKIYLDDNTEFNNPKIFSGIYDTTFTIESTITGKINYWKVLAKNIKSDSLWSAEVGSFPKINPVHLFSLLEPDYDVILETTKPKFKWNKANTLEIEFPWEMEYKIFLDDKDNFSSPRIITVFSDTTCIVDSLVPGTTYFWKVLAKNIAGDSLWSSETNAFFVSHNATAIEKESRETPESFELFQNYPNPFNPQTTIKYALPSANDVKVKIYNPLGQLVEVLVDARQTAGLYTVKWNAENMPSGVYFCVVQAGQFKAAQKMLLVR